MSPTLVSRISSPATQAIHRATFSTSAPLLKLDVVAPAPVARWRWNNLSPRTRRYVVVGLAISTCVDTWVLYNYWAQIFGTEGPRK